MADLIDRQAAVELIKNYCENGCDLAEDKWCPSCQREQFVKLLKELPSAQPDLSGYSSRLWKAAYERGKAEAQAEIVRCKDCKHRIEHKHYGDLGESAYTCEGNMVGWILPDGFCSHAEREANGN